MGSRKESVAVKLNSNANVLIDQKPIATPAVTTAGVPLDEVANNAQQTVNQTIATLRAELNPITWVPGAQLDTNGEPKDSKDLLVNRVEQVGPTVAIEISPDQLTA